MKMPVITGTIKQFFAPFHVILIGLFTFTKYLLPLQKVTTCWDQNSVAIKEESLPHTMNTVVILLFHILDFSHSEPDTHVHVYLPPEGGQGS